MTTDLTQMRDGTEMTQEIGMTQCQHNKGELEVHLRRRSIRTTTMRIETFKRAMAVATDSKMIDTEEDHQSSLTSVISVSVLNTTIVEALHHKITRETDHHKDLQDTNKST